MISIERHFLWLVILAGSVTPLMAQPDWLTYGHDKGAQRYSSLTQIDTRNVSKLTLTWTFDMQTGGDFGRSESTPLVVNGVVYLSWPYQGIKTGASSAGGPITTAGGLIFIGAARDRRFRAFETRTGRELWSVTLAEAAESVPITYRGRNDKQYVSVAAGSKLLTFALP